MKGRVCRFIDYKLVNNIDDPVAKSKKGERKWVNDQIKSKSTAQCKKPIKVKVDSSIRRDDNDDEWRKKNLH